MNPTSTPDGLDPANPLSIEDDPVLQAIEAHEARPDDVYTKHVPAVVTPTPVATPAPVPAPIPEPVIAPTPPEPVVIAPAPAPVTPTPTPAPATIPVINQPIQQKVVEKPKKPLTPAEKIAEEIANNPATKAPFQFFIYKQVSKKTTIIIFVIIAIILVGIGAYVVLNTQA